MTSVDGSAHRLTPVATASTASVDWSDAARLPQPDGPASEATHPDWAHSHYPTMVEPDRLTRLVNWIALRSPRWLAPLAMLGCIGSAVGYTVLTEPTTSAPDAVPNCVVKLTTGLDCPGCGGTRAFWYLLHGNLAAAARHHLLFVFAVPFLIYLYIAWAGRQVFRWRLPQLVITPTVIGAFLVAWLVFSVLRNLPWAPFTWFYV